MDILRKLGQLVMPRLDFRDGDPMPRARGLVSRFNVGGFLLFGGDVILVSESIKELQRLSRVPLFFAVDAERGVGQIVEGGALFPYAMAFGAAADERLLEREARLIAREMRSIGLNMLLAPVVDVNTDPRNPIINVRAYGDDPAGVARLAQAFIKGAADGGVLACAKHFPGHGGVDTDSHVSLPRSLSTREDLLRCDLVPFRETIASGVPVVMIAHLALPRIDVSGRPVTLSPEAIEGILRGELGFSGLVLTDSFRMDALSGLGGEADLAAAAIAAGCDFILDPKEPEALIEDLSLMLSSGGGLNELEIESHVDRITGFKKSHLGRAAPKGHRFDAGEAAEQLNREVAEGSVCLVKGGPLRAKRAALYIMDSTGAVGTGNDVTGKEFLSRLAESGVECSPHYVGLSGEDAPLLPHEGFSGGAVVALVYTGVAAWKGYTELPAAFQSLLNRLMGCGVESALVSFGSPYVFSGFKGFHTIVAAFDRMPEMERAAAGVLLGSLKPRGRMPVGAGFL